ncbi:MAG: spermidine synthase, partial [Myxococcota bacterium]
VRFSCRDFARLRLAARAFGACGVPVRRATLQAIVIDFDVLDSADTPIGLIYLSRRELLNQPGAWVYDVHIEGNLLMSSVSPRSERQLATSGLALHRGGEGLRVLVGGLGLGYTAQAALASPRPSTVRVIDRMDFVIRWLEEGRLPLSDELNGDPRLELVQGDVYRQLLAPATKQWDLILVDVDHSPDDPLDPASREFYTLDGQAKVAEHLAPGGVLGVWSADDNDGFAAVLQVTYPEAQREHVRWVVEHEGEDDEPLHNVLFFARKPAHGDPSPA